MTVDQADQTVVTQGPVAVAAQRPLATTNRRVSSVGPGASEQVRRSVVLVFGLIQILIGARIVLLLLDAREGNALVSGVLNLSQFFVGPFDGILRANSVHASGSVLDLSAVLAFVGWTILEVIVVWAVGIFRRDRVYSGA